MSSEEEDPEGDGDDKGEDDAKIENPEGDIEEAEVLEEKSATADGGVPNADSQTNEAAPNTVSAAKFASVAAQPVFNASYLYDGMWLKQETEAAQVALVASASPLPAARRTLPENAVTRGIQTDHGVGEWHKRVAADRSAVATRWSGLPLHTAYYAPVPPPYAVSSAWHPSHCAYPAAPCAPPWPLTARSAPPRSVRAPAAVRVRTWPPPPPAPHSPYAMTIDHDELSDEKPRTRHAYRGRVIGFR